MVGVSQSGIYLIQREIRIWWRIILEVVVVFIIPVSISDIVFQSSGHLAGVHYVGVSHSGIYLIQRVKNMVEDYLDVIEHIR